MIKVDNGLTKLNLVYKLDPQLPSKKELVTLNGLLAKNDWVSGYKRAFYQIAGYVIPLSLLVFIAWVSFSKYMTAILITIVVARVPGCPRSKLRLD